MGRATTSPGIDLAALRGRAAAFVRDWRVITAPYYDPTRPPTFTRW